MPGRTLVKGSDSHPYSISICTSGITRHPCNPYSALLRVILESMAKTRTGQTQQHACIHTSHHAGLHSLHGGPEGLPDGGIVREAHGAAGRARPFRAAPEVREADRAAFCRRGLRPAGHLQRAHHLRGMQTRDQSVGGSNSVGACTPPVCSGAPCVMQM